MNDFQTWPVSFRFVFVTLYRWYARPVRESTGVDSLFSGKFYVRFFKNNLRNKNVANRHVAAHFMYRTLFGLFFFFFVRFLHILNFILCVTCKIFRGNVQISIKSSLHFRCYQWIISAKTHFNAKMKLQYEDTTLWTDQIAWLQDLYES